MARAGRTGTGGGGGGASKTYEVVVAQHNIFSSRSTPKHYIFLLKTDIDENFHMSKSIARAR